MNNKKEIKIVKHFYVSEIENNRIGFALMKYNSSKRKDHRITMPEFVKILCFERLKELEK